MATDAPEPVESATPMLLRDGYEGHRDASYVSPYRRRVRPGDGLPLIVFPGRCLARGGCCLILAARCRSGTLANRELDFLGAVQGLRPARPVDD